MPFEIAGFARNSRLPILKETDVHNPTFFRILLPVLVPVQAEKLTIVFVLSPLCSLEIYQAVKQGWADVGLDRLDAILEYAGRREMFRGNRFLNRKE